MTPRIVPTTRQTYRQAALVLGKAFASEPVSVFVFRTFTPERRIRSLSGEFATEMVFCQAKACPVHVEEGGKIVAAAIIYPPGTYPLPNIVQWLILAKSVLTNGWYDIRSWEKWSTEAGKLHPTKPHYYLPCIGVDPYWQGRGLGSLIMTHLADQADQAGVGCYLENADPRNLPFYQRFGFSVVNEKEVIGIHNWYLWRDPE